MAPLLSPELEAARERVWDRAVLLNPVLFDRPVVACAGLRREDPDTLFLRWVPATYRHYVRSVPGVVAEPMMRSCSARTPLRQHRSESAAGI